MVRFTVFAGLLALGVLLLCTTPARAQDPTDTPTETPTPAPSSTPSYLVSVPMSTGSQLLLQKTVTYGDIAVVVAVLLLAAVEIVRSMVIIPKMWKGSK